MDHGDFDPSLAGARTDLVVPSQATVVAQPSEGALHDPTPWQNGKARSVPVLWTVHVFLAYKSLDLFSVLESAFAWSSRLK